MKMKSVRLDIPARKCRLSDIELRSALSNALLAAASHGENNSPVAEACEAAGLALISTLADVDEYDDLREKNGGKPLVGPVFYIP